jgi:hypothetical protein
MAVELEKLARRYQNIKKELKNTHTCETSALMGKNRSGIGRSTLNLDQSSRLLFSASRARRSPDASRG